MIPALLLVLFAVVYRIVTGLMIQSGSTWLSNFAPFAAIALCSAAYLPARLRFSLPLLALLLSDVVLNYYYGQAFFTPLIVCRYLALAGVCWLGHALQSRASFATMLPASVAASTLFYIVTNSFSWLTDVGYVKNAAGWLQALTVGLPQYGATPTWMFFRNSLLSDLVFTTLFVACMHFVRSDARARSAASLPRTA